jgi:hypothetical protein
MPWEGADLFPKNKNDDAQPDVSTTWTREIFMQSGQYNLLKITHVCYQTEIQSRSPL